MKSLWLPLTLIVFISLASTAPTPPPFYLRIWVDKGCGGQYFVGDMINVYWEVPYSAQILFWEKEPDGTKRIVESAPVYTLGKGSRGWLIKDFGYGKRAIYAEATSIWGHVATAECDFYVVKKAANIVVSVKDQDGESISGVNVLLDSVSVASTDSAGTCTLPEVAFGEHLVTAQYGGEEKTSRIEVASTQKQSLTFVFTVVKKGTIKVRVFDQKGTPLADVDVYVDGVLQGKTAEGVLTVPATVGDHIVEARWQDERAEKMVTVVKNQISFADLTLTLTTEVPAHLIVSVRDNTGNAVSDASVFLDNILLGRSDTQGRVEAATVTVGPHTIRAEKQGFQAGTQNVDVRAGENTVTVVIEPEKAALSLVLTLAGLLYMLKRRRT